MKQVRHTVCMTALVIALLLLVGPLAVLYGTDSRLDDRRR
jgi:hypothetical protein